MTSTRVVIIGGGFAGIRAALRLARFGKRLGISVMLLDREPTHVYAPVLYEVASAFAPWEREGIGTIGHDQAGVSFQSIFDGTPVLFVQGAVNRVNVQTRTVILNDGQELAAEILLLTLGSQTHTFGVPGVAKSAFGVKTLHEAAELRHHQVALFLRHRSSSRRVQEHAFTVVVAGGGLAGVETAAEIRLFQQKLAALHRVPHSIPRVELYESGECILREYPPSLRQRGLARLKQLGVGVHTRVAITAVYPDRVEFAGGSELSTNTVVWLCGVRAHDVLLRSGLPVHPRGGVIVEETLEVRGHRNIFAAGDCVYAADPRTGRITPDVAWAALQQGNVVAENIRRRLAGLPLTTYLLHPRPVLATVGGKYALAYLPPFEFAGWFGWAMKQLVGLFYLFEILPNFTAFRLWAKSIRMSVAND